MTPTPTQIATQAAEHIRLNNEMVRGGYDTPHTTESIILSAAAKMVRESGAVEALEAAKERCGQHRMTNYYCGNMEADAVEYALQEKLFAALQSLRSITGEAGK